MKIIKLKDSNIFPSTACSKKVFKIPLYIFVYVAFNSKFFQGCHKRVCVLEIFSRFWYILYNFVIQSQTKHRSTRAGGTLSRDLITNIQYYSHMTGTLYFKTYRKKKSCFFCSWLETSLLAILRTHLISINVKWTVNSI